MAISGKYDFQGIKKMGAGGLKIALASSQYFAWILKFGPITDALLEFLTNWLANKGLLLMNVGAIYVDGKLDQNLLDRALDSGIKAVENAKSGLTPKQIKEIDDAVIKAADRALPYGS